MWRTESLEKTDPGQDWRQEKGMTEDEMVGWHHRLNEHEFEQALGVGDGQGNLACCGPWSDWVTELNWRKIVVTMFCGTHGPWTTRMHPNRQPSVGAWGDPNTNIPPTVTVLFIAGKTRATRREEFRPFRWRRYTVHYPQLLRPSSSFFHSNSTLWCKDSLPVTKLVFTVWLFCAGHHPTWTLLHWRDVMYFY